MLTTRPCFTKIATGSIISDQKIGKFYAEDLLRMSDWNFVANGASRRIAISGADLVPTAQRDHGQCFVAKPLGFGRSDAANIQQIGR